MNQRWSVLLIVVSGLAAASTGGPEPTIEFPAVGPAVDLPSHIDSQARGMELPTAPKVLPDLGLPAEPTLEDINLHLRAGDSHRALLAAERFVEQNRWGREAAAAWMALGMLHREEGRHNLASEAFTKVRVLKGPLSPWGAFYEAEQDLVRGKPGVAVHECEAYRETYAKGEHVGSCLRIIAKGWASQGDARRALQAADEYDREHEEAPITEQIELALAQWQVVHQPEHAVKRLRDLTVTHTAPLTGRVAEQLLAHLDQQGVDDAAIPQDLNSRKQRALSLRTSGRRDQAWALFEDLIAEAEENPSLNTWVSAEATNFGWLTRRYDFLAELYTKRFANQADPETAKSAFKALSRAGQHQDASEWGRLGLNRFANDSAWRRSEEDVARTLMLASEYREARTLMDAAAARGGWSGRRAAYFAAFNSYMAGDLEDALDRFNAIIDQNRSYKIESRYWRAKALDSLGEPELADQDRDWVASEEPHNWYAVLIRQGRSDDMPFSPFARNGEWPGSAIPGPIEPPSALETNQQVAITAVNTTPAPRHATPAFSMLSWPMRTPVSAANTVESASVMRADPFAAPASYSQGVYFDEIESRRAFRDFARRYDGSWHTLPAVEDLARVGLYDLSGPLMSKMFEDWRDAWKYAGHQRHQTARSMGHMKNEDWRQLFLFVRDHHHASRFTHGLDQNHPDDDDASRHALKLTMPLAHSRYVWQHGRDENVDPLLVMGLMRTESIYDANALSRVGARGAMQIMPRTGHLLADIARETDFTSDDLTDPVLSVGYGIHYLGLLMERYDQVYPLAVASYNGGPHNVSSWLEGTGSDMPMDEFAEHIPFQETRNYVKRVSGAYDTYISLYAPVGSSLEIPPHPLGNHPDIVDF